MVNGEDNKASFEDTLTAVKNLVKTLFHLPEVPKESYEIVVEDDLHEVEIQIEIEEAFGIEFPEDFRIPIESQSGMNLDHHPNYRPLTVRGLAELIFKLCQSNES